MPATCWPAMATSASSSSPVNTDRTRPPVSTASAGTSLRATARRCARSGSGMVWAKDTARKRRAVAAVALGLSGHGVAGRVIGVALAALIGFAGTAIGVALILRIFPPHPMPFHAVVRGTIWSATTIRVLTVAFGLVLRSARTSSSTTPPAGSPWWCCWRCGCSCPTRCCWSATGSRSATAEASAEASGLGQEPGDPPGDLLARVLLQEVAGAGHELRRPGARDELREPFRHPGPEHRVRVPEQDQRGLLPTLHGLPYLEGL